MCLHLSTPSIAAPISFIRDAEIEETLALWAEPIFEVAGLSSDAVQIYLVKDSRLNAFVAGGQKMFFHTGLLQRSETPEQVIGVLAHESGHIAGGHLARLKQRLDQVPAESIIGMILGGAAAAAGQGQAAGALIFGGQQASQRSLLSYTRAHEGAADQAAVNYLEQSGISSKGLLDFFKILRDQEITATSQQNPYIRSHPLTAERINFISNHLTRSAFTAVRVSDDWIMRHARMRAKLDAYLLSFTHVLRLYPSVDQSVPARYARAFAYHLDAQTEKAIAEIDSLIAESPNDAYFHELKGQIYFENGQPLQAIPSYKQAISLMPNTSLFQLALGRAYLDSGDVNLLEEAIDLLEDAAQGQRKSSFVWRQLAIAYGKNGQMAESSLALAEEAYMQRRYKDAVFLAGRAEKDFKVGSRLWLQAEDVRLSAERLLKQRQQR